MTEGKNCPKCGSKLSPGLLREMNEYGRPQKVWAAANEPTIPWKNAPPRYWITAYRCVECGFLELYATNEEK